MRKKWQRTPPEGDAESEAVPDSGTSEPSTTYEADQIDQEEP